MELLKGRPESAEGRLDKEMRVYDLLDSLGVEYGRVDHEAAMTMEACDEIDRVLSEGAEEPVAICKNLFLCNRQATEFYLLLIPGDKPFKTKYLSAQIGSSRLSFAKPEAMQEYLDITPGSVSVMGLNVWQKDVQGQWLCGSFSGLFAWNRTQETVTDWFTGEPAEDKAGPPFGKKAVSGFSADLGKEPFAVEYYNGTDALPQPEILSTLPMSLWNVALEVHSGRIYIGIAATYVFVFIAGFAVVWCLWSGWKLRRKNRFSGRSEMQNP